MKAQIEELIKQTLRRHYLYTSLIIVEILFLISLSGCEVGMLGLEAEEASLMAKVADEAGLLRDVGVKVESGRLMIIEDNGAFNAKLENVKLNETNELYTIKNGSRNVFAKLVDEGNIQLIESPYKNINLGGKLYLVRGNNVYVRSTPYYKVNNSNWTGVSYNSGRLVMVVGEENGWFKIPLYPGSDGYIESKSLVPAVTDYKYSENQIPNSTAINLNKINMYPESYVSNSNFVSPPSSLSFTKWCLNNTECNLLKTSNGFQTEILNSNSNNSNATFYDIQVYSSNNVHLEKDSKYIFKFKLKTNNRFLLYTRLGNSENLSYQLQYFVDSTIMIKNTDSFHEYTVCFSVKELKPEAVLYFQFGYAKEGTVIEIKDIKFDQI